jgi:hypothetical protein
LSSDKPSNKRKSTEDHAPQAEVNLDDINVDGMVMDNCDQVRRKINRLIDSGAITKTAFAREIGVSAKSLNGFLGVHGPMNGAAFAAYDAAWEYFKKREIAGIKLPVKAPAKVPAAKKQKTATASASPTASTSGAAGTAASAATSEGQSTATATAASSGAVPDISDIVLPGEENDAVPVFDTCDEIRRKINAHLKKPGVTQAQFCRDVYAQLKGPSRPGKPFQGVQLARFRGMKGPLSGAKSSLYYGAYVFFEKVRIKEGKPKSKHRLDMEKQWDAEGIDREHDHRSL